ncbi:sigma-54-dependent Fis family transcriptional regulator [Desulforhabdus sp. TSK]|uniref:sigma-54 interaction domain-containing protein n=1 Tax=Desulforhabdus sp. TSK TaxID=2925014 RepID=UPI001FC8C03B|nr:sigma 54-interacting transcriptional regulator [Desulforhabdus sp. TSK]GKT06937.1 ATPase AAA [Desulforhabdus sp. TSK]
MKVDANEFFRQATIHICSSLDIKKAMQRCLQYIEHYMPVSWMSLYLYEQETGILSNLATVSSRGSITPLPPVVLPQNAIMQIEDEFSKWQGVKIVGNPEHDAVSWAVYQQTGKADISLLVMRLVIEEQRLGALTLIAESKNCYDQTHADLLGLLREPFDIAVSNALRYMEAIRLKDMLDAENRRLNRELSHVSLDEIIGADSGLKGVLEMARQVAHLNSPVMLLGETGVGKEIIANAIHYTSPRKNGPFIKVNCGAIPDTLFDSELFGHEKGAFTGAATLKRGYFERAHTGTIFLDEIGELPLQAQVRLLRVLQEKEIHRVGGTRPVPVDVRIITATHRNLEDMIKTGLFREDLWFRLNIFPITIPPLRHRKEDIPMLFHHFMRRKSKELKIHTIPPVTARSIERLQSYPWPGNVRELENLVERALILSCGRHGNTDLEIEFLCDWEARKDVQPFCESGQPVLSLDQAVTHHIQKLLTMTNGKIYGTGGAAELLQINPNTLRSRMRKLNIPFGRSGEIPASLRPENML